MHYTALVTIEGKYTLAEFPDCPGCQTSAEPGEDLLAMAREALEGWLESHLEHGEAPPRPATSARVPKGARRLAVGIDPRLAVALSVRWARQDANLTQAEFAKRMYVSQQQAAKLENPSANPTIATLAKVAAAVGAEVEVALVRVTA